MKPKVLIVEDSFILATHLADIVQQELEAEPVLCMSVKEALQITTETLTIAFLDIEILDCDSFPVARKLREKNVPFVFVSGRQPGSLPPDLKHTPFLPKPVDPRHLVTVVKTLSSAFNRPRSPKIVPVQLAT